MTIPPKAKARLCVGGHRDPDLQSGQLTTEAPTATKTSITCLVFLTAQMGWTLAAGDIEAAFLNGVEARRDLYFEPPADDLQGVEPGGLIEIVKGVFGLSTSPRLWWDKLAQSLLEVKVETAHGTLHLVQHSLDNCLFLVINKDNQLFGLLATHADDILVSAPTPVRKALEQALSGVFPIDAWEEASTGLEYCGATVKQEKNQVTLSTT